MQRENTLRKGHHIFDISTMIFCKDASTTLAPAKEFAKMRKGEPFRRQPEAICHCSNLFESKSHRVIARRWRYRIEVGNLIIIVQWIAWRTFFSRVLQLHRCIKERRKISKVHHSHAIFVWGNCYSHCMNIVLIPFHLPSFLWENLFAQTWGCQQCRRRQTTIFAKTFIW